MSKFKCYLSLVLSIGLLIFASSASARFYSVDPVSAQQHVDSGNLQGFNRYAYANNNPYKYVDPDGRSPAHAVKFLADVGLNMGINYMTTGSFRVGAALKDSAMGMLNPLSSLNKIKKLKSLASKTKGHCCFVAGTKVLTDDGYQNIEDIQLNDLVLSKDVETGEQDWKPVTQLFTKHRQIYELVVSLEGGEQEIIKTTDDHPFFVSEQVWKDTIELLPGDLIETEGFGWATVFSITNTGNYDTTYNLEVADFHTYYATELNLLVHNCGGDVTKSGDKFTKEVVKRGKPGRDGGQSQHVIEKVDGQTTSTTHQVVKDGKLIHQHQDHVGKHGTVRRFADELTGTETINAPKVKDTMTGGRLGFPPGS